MSFLVLTNLFLQLLFSHLHARDDPREAKMEKEPPLRVPKAEALI